MVLRVPNEGESQALGISLGKIAVESLRLRLFSNNVTPGETDTSATYTEVTGSGYASVLLTAANWVLTEGAPTEAAYPEVTFAFTGAAGNVYGYYITGETSGKVRWAERFTSAPFNVTASGDQIKVTPKITAQDTQD